MATTKKKDKKRKREEIELTVEEIKKVRRRPFCYAKNLKVIGCSRFARSLFKRLLKRDVIDAARPTKMAGKKELRTQHFFVSFKKKALKKVEEFIVKVLKRKPKLVKLCCYLRGQGGARHGDGVLGVRLAIRL